MTAKHKTRQVYRAKVALKELTVVDFKLRYQGSFLGYAWALLRPLLLFIVIYLVFTRFFNIGKGVDFYPVYLLLGITMWNFFSEMTSSSIKSVVSKGNLIRKLNFPKPVIPLTHVTSASINTLFSMVIVVALATVDGVDLRGEALLVILPLVEILLVGVGCSFFLAALYVRFRDLGNIWAVVIQAGFYLTPIIYPLSIVGTVNYQKILMINPIAQAIQDARWLLVSKDTLTIDTIFGSHLYRLIPLTITIAVFFAGIIFYRSKADYFAEEV